MRRIAPETAGEVVRVECCEGLPARVIWRGRPLQVRSIEAIWCAEGRWWMRPERTGIQRRYFRLSVAPPGMPTPLSIEVYRQGPLWKVWRVAD